MLEEQPKVVRDRIEATFREKQVQKMDEFSMMSFEEFKTTVKSKEFKNRGLQSHFTADPSTENKDPAAKWHAGQLRLEPKMKHLQEMFGWSMDDYMASIERQVQESSGATVEQKEVYELNKIAESYGLVSSKKQTFNETIDKLVAKYSENEALMRRMRSLNPGTRARLGADEAEDGDLTPLRLHARSSHRHQHSPHTRHDGLTTAGGSPGMRSIDAQEILRRKRGEQSLDINLDTEVHKFKSGLDDKLAEVHEGRRQDLLKVQQLFDPSLAPDAADVLEENLELMLHADEHVETLQKGRDRQEQMKTIKQNVESMMSQLKESSDAKFLHEQAQDAKSKEIASLMVAASGGTAAAKRDYLARKFVNILKQKVEERNTAVQRQAFEAQAKEIMKALTRAKLVKTAKPDAE